MTDIVPAVLPKSFAALEESLARLVGAATKVQVDVVADIFEGQEGLPHWEEFDFEFDLYVEPGGFVMGAGELGASSIVVHARHASARAALQELQSYRGGDFAVRVGLALRPTDMPEALDAFAGLYDFVQVMGIDNEGRQGEPFNPHTIELVRALRMAHVDMPVQVDGHAAGHEHELAEAGATTLVVGSAILTADNPKSALKEAYTRANGS